MTQTYTPHDPCPICDRPNAAHTVTDHLACFEALRKRNQAERAVDFERQYSTEMEATRAK